MKKKPIIAIDVDDVLSRTSEGFIEFSNKTWGHALTPDDYDEDWARAWNTSVETARSRADILHASGVFSEFSYYAEALPVLTKLKKHYSLVVATSRRASISEESQEWLNRYYPNIFDDVFFSGIYDSKLGKHKDHIARTKNDLLVEIGADYLIDDQLKHCVAAGQHGVNTILFGDYAWNRSDELPSHVTRCSDWQAVEAYFAARS